MKFQKGRSGNPKGRPKKGESLTDILNLKLDKKNESGKLLREVIADKLIMLAEGGDIVALKYLMDRCDGKPKESIELTNGTVDIKLREIMGNGA